MMEARTFQILTFPNIFLFKDAKNKLSLVYVAYNDFGRQSGRELHL